MVESTVRWIVWNTHQIAPRDVHADTGLEAIFTQARLDYADEKWSGERQYYVKERRSTDPEPMAWSVGWPQTDAAWELMLEASKGIHEFLVEPRESGTLDLPVQFVVTSGSIFQPSEP